MKHTKRVLAATLICLAAAVTPSFAGLGFHAGASLDPDDFIAGIRFKTHPIAESIYIVPNVEVGFGDITMIAGNLDGHYKFKTSSKYAPYVGAGLTLNWFDFEDEGELEFGGSILGGLMITPKWFFEMKVGLGDVPDFKFVVGFEKP